MCEQKRTTMAVRELQELLGIHKTDTYWLVHKQYFETILVEGKMRIVIESFEHWYANQVKYRKVDGPPPGEELKAYSYSVKEMADVLGETDDVVYRLIRNGEIETFEVGTWMRIRKDVFDAWYKSQKKYRTAEDRARDREREESSMTVAEIADLLLIPKSQAYRLVCEQDDADFEFIVVAGRKRVTKESFERWYAGQSKYRKLCDRSPEEIAELKLQKQVAAMPRLKVDENKTAFDVKEAAILLNLREKEVREMIRSGELEAKMYGKKYMIHRSEIQWFLLQQKMSREDQEGGK